MTQLNTSFSESEISRFWNRVDTSGGPDACWPWTASLSGRGYGRLRADAGREINEYAAHRFSYELHNGPIGEGLVVCHQCNNKLCCNPAHLHLGTVQQNTLEAYRDKLLVPPAPLPGEQNPSAKLTAAQVRQIRRRYNPPDKGGNPHQGVSLNVLAREYQVHLTTIQLIVTGKTWRNLPMFPTEEPIQHSRPVKFVATVKSSLGGVEHLPWFAVTAQEATEGLVKFLIDRSQIIDVRTNKVIAEWSEDKARAMILEIAPAERMEVGV